MSTSKYPYKKTIALETDTETALKQVARWRACYEADIIRGALDVVFKREYQLRGVPYPNTADLPLPGQIALPGAGQPAPTPDSTGEQA